ncbi:MAG: hypothetical protein JNM25_07640, partial [Planctomycetes bacterium]|nr:hypothetical protein [Planctomycetota bacterium]
MGLLALSLATSTASAQSILSQYSEIVQACGDTVPGPSGAMIDPTSHLNLGTPTMDANGTVLFRSRMAVGVGGADANNNRAYFLGRTQADLQIAVRAGDQAPGCPAGTLLLSGTNGSLGLGDFPRISPSNEILFFQSSLYDPTTPTNTPASSDTALFWGPAGSVSLLAREGDPVPFLGGETWANFYNAVKNTHVNSNGSVLFTAALGGASAATDTVLVTRLGGNLVPVLREGDLYPFGGTVVPVGAFDPLNNLGQLNASGQVLHDVKSSTGEYAIAVWTAGNDVLIAREGQQAPGLAAGVVFATNGIASNSGCFNAAGRTVLVTSLSGPGVVSGVNDQAMYLAGTGGLSLILRRGDAVPGLPGVTWKGVDAASVFLNDQDEFSFAADLGGAVTSANDSSTWVGSVGNLIMIAREGDFVPGMTPAATWKYGVMDFALLRRPYLSQHRYVLFQNTVSDGVATKQMFFGYTPALGIVQLLDGTDTFTTPLGTAGWTTATQFGSPNSSDATPAWCNANGDFVCKVVLGSPAMGAIVRGHLGSLVAEPSAVPVAGNVPHNFHIDLGVAQANRLYLVLATSMGTRPGFPSPFGPQVVPLNIDPLWTDLSLQGSNSIVWPNSLGFLDANGKGIGPSA